MNDFYTSIDNALHLIGLVFWLGVLFDILMIPFAIIRRTRGFAAGAIIVASFIFGICLWLESLALSLILAGLFWTIAGVLSIVGIVPVAIIAAILHGWWLWLLELFLLIVATFGSRGLALWLAAKE